MCIDAQYESPPHLGYTPGDRWDEERPDEGEQTDHVRQDEQRDPHPRDEAGAPFSRLGLANVRGLRL